MYYFTFKNKIATINIITLCLLKIVYRNLSFTINHKFIIQNIQEFYFFYSCIL